MLTICSRKEFYIMKGICFSFFPYFKAMTSQQYGWLVAILIPD